MAFDPRQLQAFLAIAEAGSLGRAAETLHLTQPALSRIVRRMEQQLGVTLFERRPNGMELTTYGQALLPYATQLTKEASLALEEINVRRGLGRGTLRIGAVASAAVMVLPDVLQQMLQRWPNLHIQITEAVEDRLAAGLANNEVDVVLSGQIPETDEVMQVADHRFTDCSRVVAAATHPLCARARVTLDDALGQSWVMPPVDAEPRRQFDAQLQALGARHARVVIETRSPSAIKALVAQSGMLGWLPEPLYAAERAASLLCTLPLPELDHPRHFHVYRRRRHFMAPPVMEFLAALRR